MAFDVDVFATKLAIAKTTDRRSVQKGVVLAQADVVARYHLVPRWRTMMLPARTASLPNFCTPRRLDCESRPLRESRLLFYVPSLKTLTSCTWPQGLLAPPVSRCSILCRRLGFARHRLSALRSGFRLRLGTVAFSSRLGAASAPRLCSGRLRSGSSLGLRRSGLLLGLLLFSLLAADRDDLEDRQLLAVARLRR